MAPKPRKKALKADLTRDIKEDLNGNITLPLIPLRDVVIYPHMVIPLFVGRAESIKALEFAMTKDKQVVLVAQKNASVDIPTEKDLFSVCLAKVSSA
jgi:ATP-dependent Lon protease